MGHRFTDYEINKCILEIQIPYYRRHTNIIVVLQRQYVMS